MRVHGWADHPGAIGISGHACWAYDDVRVDFREAAEAFLREGLALGVRLGFVGSPEAEQSLRDAEPFRSMVADGTLLVLPFDVAHPGGRRRANPDQWRFYLSVLEDALAEGYAGLRVLAEFTSLARPEHAWADHAAWESYADRLIVDRPLSALCCFDRMVVRPQALGVIAGAHPVVDRRLADVVPFGVYAVERLDGATVVKLVGEVDAFSADDFELLLGAGPADLGERVVLDLADLAFVDHHAVRAIRRYAHGVQRRGGEVVLLDAPVMYERVSRLLGKGA